MKNFIYLIFAIISLSCNAVQDQPPQVEITNGLITAKLYLPDAERGYYQGCRFDWSGVIFELKYNGHDYFGPWNPIRDPNNHDAISGPVEEFFQIGYEEAPVGGEFLRIGIGGLLKSDEEEFNRRGFYEFSNPGKWTVSRAKDQIVFTHVLNDVAGYSYVYEKTVRLIKDKPEMVLAHTLKNTGRKAIETIVYDHNYFTIDHQTTGPDFVVKFTFPLSSLDEIHPAVRFNDRQLEYVRALEPEEVTPAIQLQGHSSSMEDYNFSIENKKTGAAVKITCDRPVIRINYWSRSNALSPEPYINLHIQPGESFTWDITYNFYTL